MATQETKEEGPPPAEEKTGLLGKVKGYGAAATEAAQKGAAKAQETAAKASGSGSGSPRDGPEEKEPKNWEANGTIFGLSIDLGMVIWLQSMPLATMFVHSLVSYGKMFPCEPGGVYNLTMFDACYCAYTKAFVRGFAPLALSVFCVLVMRNLVQKRLYYFTLKLKGVIEFGANNPFKDYFFLAALIGYLHIILHMLFIVWATGFFSSDSSSKFMQHAGDTVGAGDTVSDGDVKHMMGDAFAFRLLVEIISLVFIPATLFLVFMYCSYDIEASLVPLSQYVHDARDAGEGAELSQLEILEDCWVKEILHDNETCIAMLSKATSHEGEGGEFSQLMTEYNKQRAELEKKELYKVGLKDSLWATQLLLPPHASQDPPAKGFRIMWMIFFCTAMFFEFLAIWLVFHYILRDLIKVLDGHTPAAISMAVECVLFSMCITIWSTMWNAHRGSRGLEIPGRENDPEAVTVKADRVEA